MGSSSIYGSFQKIEFGFIGIFKSEKLSQSTVLIEE